MFWQKRNDGFEWHKYVRTTIKLKREDRRRRIDHARSAAVEGLKGAGRAGFAAGRVAGRAGLAAAGTALAMAWYGSRVGARAGLAGARTGLAIAAELIVAGSRLAVALLVWLTRHAARAAVLAGAGLVALLRPHCHMLAQRPVRSSLLLVGAIAALATATGLMTVGLSLETMIAAAVAAGVLLLAGLPVLLGEQDPPRIAIELAGWARDRFGLLPPGIRSGAGFAVLAAAFAGVAWSVAPGGAGLAALPGLVLGSQAIEGRATALTGDTLRVRDTAVRLAAVEAPEADQRCERPGNRRWKCGEAAQEALARAVRGALVRCDLGGSDEGGRPLGTCYVKDRDIAAGLVRDGFLFSSGWLFARYRAEEKQARANRAGVWQGEPEHPSEYRAKLWEAAKRTAPDECPIKGQIASGARYYVLPWSPNYARVQVRTARGERWFCSEREALAAGWKPLERS